MVRPWVDVGSVGTLTLNRLERHLGSKELGKLARPGNFFDFTRYRPTMRSVEGRREVQIPNSIIRYAKTESGPDYLFFHLLEPHSNGEDYTDSIMELVKYFNVKRYCRVGAMYDAVPHTRPLLVTGSLGSVQQIRPVPNFRVRSSTYQGPTTIMNLLSEGVEGCQIESINFMVHLPQYVQLEEDFAGTSRMIEVLSSVYENIPGDIAPVRRGQRQYREMSASIERNTELKELILQMEAYYDAQLDSDEAKTGEPAPTAELSPEIERFLSELGETLDSDRDE
ncbi:MAG: PAC2 family protein [Chloroflexi bacterium]|nr:PAC2 family protein [Chloroflexota bacterium]